MIFYYSIKHVVENLLGELSDNIKRITHNVIQGGLCSEQNIVG